MIKKFAFALLPAIALVACGDDDSGSGTIDFEDSFEMVLNKASYEYDDEDSTFKLIKPVCKVERPGNLMGPEDVDEWDTTSYKAREKKGNITLKHGDWHDEGLWISAYDADSIIGCSGNTCDIAPCHSDEFPSKVRRPAFSVLDKTKVKATFGITVPHWYESLKKCIERLSSM